MEDKLMVKRSLSVPYFPCIRLIGLYLQGTTSALVEVDPLVSEVDSGTDEVVVALL